MSEPLADDFETIRARLAEIGWRERCVLRTTQANGTRCWCAAEGMPACPHQKTGADGAVSTAKMPGLTPVPWFPRGRDA